MRIGERKARAYWRASRGLFCDPRSIASAVKYQTGQFHEEIGAFATDHKIVQRLQGSSLRALAACDTNLTTIREFQ